MYPVYILTFFILGVNVLLHLWKRQAGLRGWLDIWDDR